MQCKYCKRTIEKTYYIGIKLWVDLRGSTMCPGGVNFENLNGYHEPEEK